MIKIFVGDGNNFGVLQVLRALPQAPAKNPLQLIAHMNKLNLVRLQDNVKAELAALRLRPGDRHARDRDPA